jgi:hypothetical protein
MLSPISWGVTPSRFEASPHKMTSASAVQRTETVGSFASVNVRQQDWKLYNCDHRGQAPLDKAHYSIPQSQGIPK